MTYFNKMEFCNDGNRIRNPNGAKKKQMLDMKREKYFRFDLDDLLVEFQIGDNKNTIAVAILNKMRSQSLEDTLDYINRIKKPGTIDDEKEKKLKTLLYKYTRWR